MSKLTSETKKALIDLGNEARRRAYVPYSNYRVGAALQGKSGRIYTGVNIENAAYPVTVCHRRRGSVYIQERVFPVAWRTNSECFSSSSFVLYGRT